MNYKNVNKLFLFEANEPDPGSFITRILITIIPKHYYRSTGYMYDQHISEMLEPLGGELPNYLREECEGLFSSERSSKTLDEVISDMETLGFKKEVFNFK